MSKVLISFLGTGGLGAKNESVRKYRTAIYQFENGERLETSFVADALVSHFSVDKVILLGTVKSMWEEVYLKFCEKREIPIDEEYATRLWEYCAAAKADTELNLPQKDKLEMAIGQSSHVELIRYGINSNEIEENEAIILGLEKYLQPKDELYVDITHAFRSLPLFLMNLLIYLQNVSSKNIQIGHIFYGMLDVSSELGYAPIVELNGIMKINEWITGAYAFKQFGNGYRIADLMETDGRKDVCNALRKFSDMLNLNHLTGVKNQIQEIASIKNSALDPIAERIIPSVVNEFICYFPMQITSQSFFQYKLACWHFEHQKYSSAYITLVEALVTYVCEALSIEWGNKENREKAKKYFNSPNKQNVSKIREYDRVKTIYQKTNKIRKGIAHSLPSDRNCASMIKTLEESLIALRGIIINK